MMAMGPALLADIDRARPPGGTLAVWWLGQHGFVLKAVDSTLYVDAFLSPLPGRTVPPLLNPAEVTNADLILGSHDHADHIDRTAWPAMAAASPNCRFVVPDLVRERVAAELSLPEERVLGINAGQTLELGACRITGIAAAHELLDRDQATGRYPYLGFVIESGGCTVYHTGDTCLYEGLMSTLKKWRFDAVFLPINGRDAGRLAAGCIGNMTYQEAADLAGALQPGLTIPTHFEMFRDNHEDPQRFVDYMRVKYPDLQVHRPEHGRRMDVVSLAADHAGASAGRSARPAEPRPYDAGTGTASEAPGELQLRIGRENGGGRPFEGFGVQCDSYLYDAVNAAAGVTEEDCVLAEKRLRAIRPSLARIFCQVDWFKPAGDAGSCRWDLPGYPNMLRLLRLLQEIGTRVNVVMFSPFWGQTMETHRASVRAMGDLLAHLRDVEGIHAVRWLTIFNEPETVFPHDSPLMRRVFGHERVDGPTNWDMLVELWQLAQERLEELKLYPQTKLAVPDCVYGSPVRYERMRLAAKVFADADVDFAVHVYSPEDLAGQPATEEQQRDWGYPGMAREATAFRELAGAGRQMILWEYNLEGMGGRTPFFPGVNRQGVPVLETPTSGAEILEKTILAVNHGYDGACLWCLNDMLYCESPAQAMQCGMWRSKAALWYPRPHYYYYTPLCQLFRAGMTRVPVEGVVAPLLAMAARDETESVVLLLNRGATGQTIRFECGPASSAQRLRIHPDIIPATDGDLPLDTWETIAADAHGVLAFDLVPNEATFLRLASGVS